MVTGGQERVTERLDRMRVALFYPFRLERSSSVGVKSERMLATWRTLGVEARGFCLSAPDDPMGSSWVTIECRRGESARQWHSLRLARQVQQWSPDVVYTRFSLWVPLQRGILPRVPLIEEVNTNDRHELPLWSMGAGVYNRLTRGFAARNRSAWVFLTPELARTTGLALPGVPWCVIGNGIDLDRLEPLPAPRNERPRGIFLAGSTSVWQGVDKAVDLARICRELDVMVVGGSPPPADAPANLEWMPYASGDALRLLLAQADFALGTLALHRKQMEEATPLKVRECLAYGIPTIIGYDDPDLTDLEEPHVLRIPNTEDNVWTARERILDFAERSRGLRIPRQKVAPLSLQHKERRRLEFFAEVVGEQRLVTQTRGNAANGI